MSAKTFIHQQSPRPTPAHSCESRNLRRIICPPYFCKNIPPHCRTPKLSFADNPPYTSRPFLRRQESPGRQPSGDNGGDNNAKSAHNPPSPSRPFLRRQESHSHMLPIIPKSADTLPFPRRPFLRRQESLSHGRHRRLNLAAMPPVKMKFLPTQEWSTGERKSIGESANCRRPPTNCRPHCRQKSTHTSISPGTIPA